MISEIIDAIALLDRVSNTVDRLPRLIANEAVNFSKDRFAAQNWVDDRTEPWKPRKKSKWGIAESKRRSQRAILVSSGRLRRSIRVVSISSDAVVIGTDVHYAKAHNEGFRGTVKQNVRSHQRNLTKFGITKKRELKRSTKIEFGRVKRGETTVKAYTRTIHQNIPRRRFLGSSAVLIRKIERLILAEYKAAIKNT